MIALATLEAGFAGTTLEISEYYSLRVRVS